jgi:transcriptional regulator with XRE-family HTH domain
MTMPLPLPVDRSLRRLGENISRARRRRRWTQASFAQRIGASLNTVRRMEDGHPGTALQHFARALHAFGELDKLAGLLDSTADSIGLVLMDEALPQRVRKPTPSPDGGAF